MQVDQEVDTRGLNCPLPILKAKKALATMQSGQLLKVVATDTGSIRDFQAFAKQMVTNWSSSRLWAMSSSTFSSVANRIFSLQ